MVEVDQFVVCPTCRYIERVEADDEDQHKQPCPQCGYALMQVRYEEWDEGDREVSTRWNVGEGAQLYLDDVIKALTRVDEFVAVEEAEERRIENELDAMRRERQAQAEEEG